MNIAVTWFARALNSLWKLKSCGISWDLLQVDLISFLASGESILGRKAAKRTTKSQDVFVPRHIKSDEGLFDFKVKDIVEKSLNIFESSLSKNNLY